MENTNMHSQTEGKESNMPKSFLDLLVVERPYKYKLHKHSTRKLRNETLTYEVDDQTKFRNSTVYARISTNTQQNANRNAGYKSFIKRRQTMREIENQYKAVNENINLVDDFEEIKYPIDVVDWENDIIYDLETEQSVIKKEKVNGTLVTELVDSILEENWENFIIYDSNIQTKSQDFMTMFVEDPNLIFEKTDEKKINKNKKRQKEYFSGDKPLKNKYNISNDKYYNLESKPKSNLGSFGVQHSLPALKLEPKFYKTNHSKEELRNFHRPAFCFPKNIQISVKDLIKNEIRNSNIIKKMNDLTLKDSDDFVLFEYSEEMPLFIVNCGMVSLINTYYRKMSQRDDYGNDQPNLNILDPEDPSPFFAFGEVNPGLTCKSLTNNLFTAPIFQHYSDDYLCVLEKNNDQYNIYIRNIPTIYCVGQEFPLEEIYAPHSRKLNIFCKNRLKVSAYRLFTNKNEGMKEFKMSQLDQLFPYFSEGSKRKWLKEYADCIKKGKENTWILKANSQILSEEDLRKLITPENICQYESMLACERKLEDEGYKCIADSQEEEDESVYIIPWQLTRNFINACNGKGLLELTGPADPTGIGEGFSFRKIKLIKGNETENRKIISEHQAKYKTEIEKIWTKQNRSLSSTKDIPFDEKYLIEPKKKVQEVVITDDILTIKRTYPEGDEEIEDVTDPRVIKLYMKLRKTIKIDEKKAVLKCGNCGQLGHMKTNKYCPKFIQSKKVTKKKIDSDRKKAKSFFQEVMLKLLTSYFNMSFSSAFHKPVSVKKFPDYPMVVEKPIDLTTIRTKVRHNKYIRFQDFIDDLVLMKSNCEKYNGTDHSLTKISDSMVNLAVETGIKEKDKIIEAENILMENDIEE